MPGREFPLPEFKRGLMYPARQAISFHFIDYVVHSWDVARTLDLPVRFGPALLEAALSVGGTDLAERANSLISKHERKRMGMAIIHATTMTPGKLELLRAWLPAQLWYVDSGRAPELTKAGGFRLDDPAGEVGIEFMVVTDGSGERAVTYQVPLTYRAGALAAAEGGLIGTAQHGVLGRRWIYDGTRDPVLVAQLAALIQGEAQPQAQGVSNTPDPTVTSQRVANGSVIATGSVAAADGPFSTDLRVQTADADGIRNGQLIVRINRILHPGNGAAAVGEAGQPCLSATWRLADGTQARGTFATASHRRTG